MGDASGGPRKGKPFTITASGTLDEAHTAGRVVVDAHLKALGVVDEDVNADQKYTWTPGIASDKAEPVLCLDIALDIPKILSEELEEEAEAQLCEVSDSDHITNIDQTDPAVTSFDVDEVIDYVNAGIDISVKAPLLPAVGFKVEQLPIAISPGLASGHHVFTSVDSSPQSNDLITVTGSVGLNDKNGEQYT